MSSGSNSVQLNQRLKSGGNLNMTVNEKSNPVNLLKTLSNTDVYTNEK